MWVAGWLVSRHTRRADVMALRAQTAEQAQVIALREERARIARELHDVVSHGLSVVVLQTLAARAALADARPTEIGRHLNAVESTARDALAEMRRMLGLLQVDDLDQTQPAAPSPGLRNLPDLVQRARSAGLDADDSGVNLDTVRSEGLSEGMELTVYRIVQEALTNAAKHAPGARVQITLARRRGPGCRRGHRRRRTRRPLRGPRGRTRTGRHARAGRALPRHTARRADLDRRIRGPGHAGDRAGRNRVDGGGARVISVLLADDQVLVRDGFRSLIEREPDLQVVAEASDGAQAITLAREHRPDVVLMDIRMPRVDGLTATRQVLAAPQPPRVLVLTTFDRNEWVYQALRAGASGFLLKDVRASQLTDAIRTVAAGESLLAPVHHHPAHRGVRQDQHARSAATPTHRAHRPRGRRAAPSGQRTFEQRNRATTGNRTIDSQNARQPATHQTRPPRSNPSRRLRLRKPPRRTPRPTHLTPTPDHAPNATPNPLGRNGQSPWIDLGRATHDGTQIGPYALVAGERLTKYLSFCAWVFQITTRRSIEPRGQIRTLCR